MVTGHVRLKVCCYLFLSKNTTLFPRLTDVASYQPARTTFDVEERESQGLSVLLDGTWRPAIWHHELVALLDKEEYGVHLYDIEPPRRNDNQPPEDITTFLSLQKGWGFRRKEDRPDILFQLNPGSDQFPDRLTPVPWLEIEVHGTLKIVLDIFSRSPLRDFKNIPLQLATNVEGGRLEAMARQDSRICSEDFIQRMIPLLDENGEPLRDEKGTILSERPVRNSLNNVKTQFRNKCRCLSWNTYGYNSEFDKRLLDELSQEDKAANTTRNLPDLTSSEITAIRSVAKGRKSNVPVAHGNSDNEATTKGEDALNSTENAKDPFDIPGPDNEGDTDPLEDHSVQAPFQAPSDLFSTGVTKSGSVAKRRQWNRKTPRKSQNLNAEAPCQLPSGPSELTAENMHADANQVIDPVLTTAAASEPSATNRSSSTPPESFHQSTEVNRIDPVLTERAGEVIDQPRESELTRKRKLVKEGEDPDVVGVSQVAHDPEREVETLIPSHKSPKILPPTHDSQVLSNFSALQHTGIPAFNLGSLHKLASFSGVGAQSVPRRSQSPQLYGSCAPRPNLPNHPPLCRPRPYLPAPSSPIEQPDLAEILQAERDRFSSISTQVLALETYKAELVNNWWKKQVDTAIGGDLYGHRFSISLSELVESSSARTDVGMRSLMSTYNIPAHYSAASIDLRQHPTLRQAVHEALCEAERFDVRNYRNNYPGALDLTTEGGFFLALAQPSTIARNDSRFTAFTSTLKLNGSLYSALWRYKQLTGRDFAPPGVPAFVSTGCSYHDAWCEIRRQVFLPYFLRFADPVEAVIWMPELGMLSMWEGGPERWETSPSHAHDRFGCRYDRQGERAMDPRGFGKEWGIKRKRVFLPLETVDLRGS